MAVLRFFLVIVSVFNLLLVTRCNPETSCGNGTCDDGETEETCASDCTVAGTSCGNGTCDDGETEETCASDCTVAGTSCGDGVCDSDENYISCAADCRISPEITAIAISSVNATSAVIAVTVNDSTGLGSIELGMHDVLGNFLNNGNTAGSGTSGTFSLTINHLCGPGGPLYPYARVCDTGGNCSRLYYNPVASSSYFTETSTDNGTGNTVTALALTVGAVPVPGDNGGTLAVHGAFDISYWTVGDDLFPATDNTIHYSFLCTVSTAYTIYWTDANDDTNYTATVIMNIYDPVGATIAINEIGGYFFPFTNSNKTGSCVIVVKPDGVVSNPFTYAVQVTAP